MVDLAAALSDVLPDSEAWLGDLAAAVRRSLTRRRPLTLPAVGTFSRLRGEPTFSPEAGFVERVMGQRTALRIVKELPVLCARPAATHKALVRALVDGLRTEGRMVVPGVGCLIRIDIPPTFEHGHPVPAQCAIRFEPEPGLISPSSP